MAKKKVAVILSGCGFLDGAEIHEATLSLLALDLEGALVTIAAPDKEQTRVVNHVSGEETREQRNVLIESARIARGEIVRLSDLNASQFDAALMPGGYGAALNLSNFAKAGAGLSLDPSLDTFLRKAFKQGRALGAMCIAPPILAKVLADEGVRGARLTIGNDPQVARAIEGLGQIHVECGADSCVTDEKYRIVTTPAYMLARSIGELWLGVQKTVRALMSL